MIALGRIVARARAPSAAILIVLATSLVAETTESPFLVANRAAMSAMMADMTIEPSGDVDRDFVAMMVPHHQGAVEMARAELRYGHDPRLLRIAQEIVVDQLQEIAAMRLMQEGAPRSVARADVSQGESWTPPICARKEP
jgi:hypothetical protein